MDDRAELLSALRNKMLNLMHGVQIIQKTGTVQFPALLPVYYKFPENYLLYMPPRMQAGG